MQSSLSFPEEVELELLQLGRAVGLVLELVQRVLRPVLEVAKLGEPQPEQLKRRRRELLELDGEVKQRVDDWFLSLVGHCRICRKPGTQ